MEKCKFCQAELADNGTFCPSCGKDNAETLEAAPAAEETVIPEAAPAEDSPKAQPKKATPGKLAMAVAAVVVLVAALLGLIMMGMDKGGEDVVPAETAVAAQETGGAAEAVESTVPADGNPDDETCKGSYTVTDEEVIAAKDIVVATMGNAQLTNGELQVYYWSMVNSFLNTEYGYYMMMGGGLDYTQPLDTQISYEDQTRTWQQYFLQEGLEYWQLSQAMAQEAEKAGITISSDAQEYLDNLEANLEQTAQSYDMTLEELLRSNVGPGAGLEEFRAFQELYSKGSNYYNTEVAKFVPTEEELEAFFDEHEEDYASGNITKDGKFVDVRHILVSVKGGTTDEEGNTTYTEEEWAACKAEAQAILDQWLSGEKTEDSFAALANETSEDPGSNTNGGLYEDVYEGQMVPNFDAWCFDESRQYGDSGLVESSYGYHVMFFVGSEPIWKSYAQQDWVTEQANQFTSSLVERYPMEVSYDKIALGYINLGG